jgi:hypothetical protein
MEKPFDLVIKNARVVCPNTTAVDCLDIAVKDGRGRRVDHAAGISGHRHDQDPELPIGIRFCRGAQWVHV